MTKQISRVLALQWSKIGLIIILFLFLSLTLYIFARTYFGFTDPYVFWAIWIACIVTLVSIAFKFDTKSYLFGMIIFQLMIGIIWVFGQASPLPTGSDAIFESQYAGTIISTGKWDVQAGAGLAKNYYGYSPLIHINMASISMVTGCDIFVIGKYFPFLERILYFLVAYVVLRKLVGNKLAIISTLFIFSSPSFILIHTSRRLLAEPFLLLVLLCFYYQLVRPRHILNQKYLVLLPIFFLSVILGHHMTFYFLIFFLIAILISFIIRNFHLTDRGLNIEKTTKFSLLFVLVISIIGGLFLIVSGIFNRDLNRAWAAINSLLSLNVTNAGSAVSEVGSSYNYPKIYVIVALLFVILFYLVLLFSLKYIKKLKNDFLRAWSIASALLLFVPAVAILTGTRDGRLFGTVGWGIGAIGMAIPAAMFIRNWWNKNSPNKRIIIVMVITLLYCGGTLIAYPIQYYCSEDTKAIIDEQTVQAGGWLESQTETSEVIGGDRISYDVITGRYMRFVRYDTTDLFFASTLEDLERNITNYSGTYSVRFFVVNKVITKYKAVGFDIVPEENIARFDQVSGLNKIYSNGEINIYLITNST